MSIKVLNNFSIDLIETTKYNAGTPKYYLGELLFNKWTAAKEQKKQVGSTSTVQKEEKEPKPMVIQTAADKSAVLHKGKVIRKCGNINHYLQFKSGKRKSSRWKCEDGYGF
jgi:hypothetical protein